MEAMAGCFQGGNAACSSSVLDVELGQTRSRMFRLRRRDYLTFSRDSNFRSGLKMQHRAATPAVFADSSHALFYSGAGEERSTTAGLKASELHQQLVIDYADDADLIRQLAEIKSKLRWKGDKAKRKENPSSSSSSSESSDSESEARRRSLRKERGKQRGRADRKVSLNPLPLFEERETTALCTLPPVDHREGNLLASHRLDEAQARVQAPENQTLAAEFDRLFSLHERVSDKENFSLSGSTKTTVEVCMGSKCKKLGALDVLSAFNERLSGSASVETVPCKCLKNCGKAVNVRFIQEDQQTEMQSQVRVEDVHLLLHQYFPQLQPSTD